MRGGSSSRIPTRISTSTWRHLISRGHVAAVHPGSQKPVLPANERSPIAGSRSFPLPAVGLSAEASCRLAGLGLETGETGDLYATVPSRPLSPPLSALCTGRPPTHSLSLPLGRHGSTHRQRKRPTPTQWSAAASASGCGLWALPLVRLRWEADGG